MNKKVGIWLLFRVDVQGVNGVPGEGGKVLLMEDASSSLLFILFMSLDARFEIKDPCRPWLLLCSLPVTKREGGSWMYKMMMSCIIIIIIEVLLLYRVCQVTVSLPPPKSSSLPIEWLLVMWSLCLTSNDEASSFSLSSLSVCLSTCLPVILSLFSCPS